MHLSKPTECITPTVNPNVNCSLWIVTMGHCKFIDYNKGTILVQDFDSGEAMGMWGQEVCGKSPYFSLFCCEPKTTLKKIKSIQNI